MVVAISDVESSSVGKVQHYRHVLCTDNGGAKSESLSRTQTREMHCSMSFAYAKSC